MSDNWPGHTFCNTLSEYKPKPYLLQRIGYATWDIKEILGYQSLDQTLDNIEIDKLELIKEVLKECEELLR